LYKVLFRSALQRYSRPCSYQRQSILVMLIISGSKLLPMNDLDSVTVSQESIVSLDELLTCCSQPSH
jgi:hypothetical protein